MYLFEFISAVFAERYVDTYWADTGIPLGTLLLRPAFKTNN